MPELAQRIEDSRKPLLLRALCNLQKPLTIKEIAAKRGWDISHTLKLAQELEPELEKLNLWDRAILTVNTAPKAINRVDKFLAVEPESQDILARQSAQGWHLLKVLDPKLRTQQIDLKHSGNVLLTISQANSKDSQAVEAMFEVIDPLHIDNQAQSQPKEAVIISESAQA